MITGPISEHLPGRLIKAAAATRTKTRTNLWRRISCRWWCHNAHCVSRLSPDTRWARTPLMSPESSGGTPMDRREDTNAMEESRSSVTKLPSADKASCRCTSATGRGQLSWKFAPKMIYLELLLWTFWKQGCVRGAATKPTTFLPFWLIFVNSSRAECLARFYAGEKGDYTDAARAHKFSSRFITLLLRLRLLKYNYAENPKATEKRHSWGSSFIWRVPFITNIKRVMAQNAGWSESGTGAISSL